MNPDPQKTIAACQLSRDFNGLPAVKALSFEVSQGEIFGLVGPDGAGKSTALRMLASILPPSSGEAWVNGLHITRDSEAVKECIGYMSQRFGLYPDLSVQENMDFYASLYQESVSRQRKEQILGFSGLAPFKARRADALSGGMKQKLGLACTLIHAPRVLFLDEPTNGVDPVSRRDFWNLLYQLKVEGVTILLSTAYMDEAERCDRIGLLHEGVLLAQGSLGEIQALMKGTLLELRCASPRQAAASLRAAGLSVVAFGDKLHITSLETGSTVQVVEATLKTLGMDIQSLQTIPPSLEDIFTSALP